MKVIFFDIDGVLNTQRTTRKIGIFNFVDARKVLRLREIVERTGANLVMSSSWRYGFEPGAFWYEREGVAQLEAEFRRLRCPKWIDVTPWLLGSKRQKEIFAWLAVHPEVDEFIIIDDVGEELVFYNDRLVLTDPSEGLNKERMEFAIQLLGEKQ